MNSYNIDLSCDLYLITLHSIKLRNLPCCVTIVQLNVLFSPPSYRCSCCACKEIIP